MFKQVSVSASSKTSVWVRRSWVAAAALLLTGMYLLTAYGDHEVIVSQEDNLEFLVGRLEQGKSYTKKCFCATSITLDPATTILAQLPGPSTNAQLKHAAINNDGVQESPSWIAKLPGTSLLVI